MTTDLSKQLGEIKRRSIADDAWFNKPTDYALDGKRLVHAHANADRKRLLHIIEVEIPGMLRAAADSYESLGNGTGSAWMSDLLHGKAQACREQATLIESITKDNANG